MNKIFTTFLLSISLIITTLHADNIKFPTFSLPNLFSPKEKISHKDISGQISLVKVFASWCHACRASHKILSSINEKHKIPIIGINYQDSKDNVISFLSSHGNPYKKIIYDMEGTLVNKLGVQALPTTFIINKKGKITYSFAGIINDQVLEKKILPRIKALQNK